MRAEVSLKTASFVEIYFASVFVDSVIGAPLVIILFNKSLEF